MSTMMQLMLYILVSYHNLVDCIGNFFGHMFFGVIHLLMKLVKGGFFFPMLRYTDSWGPHVLIPHKGFNEYGCI
jgi:phosphate starvation-inducible membrane PsiE